VRFYCCNLANALIDSTNEVFIRSYPKQNMVREARSTDSSQIACLLGELGYPSSDLFVRGRLGHLSLNAENQVFVAEHDGELASLMNALFSIFCKKATHELAEFYYPLF